MQGPPRGLWGPRLRSLQQKRGLVGQQLRGPRGAPPAGRGPSRTAGTHAHSQSFWQGRLKHRQLQQQQQQQHEACLAAVCRGGPPNRSLGLPLEGCVNRLFGSGVLTPSRRFAVAAQRRSSSPVAAAAAAEAAAEAAAAARAAASSSSKCRLQQQMQALDLRGTSRWLRGIAATSAAAAAAAGETCLCGAAAEAAAAAAAAASYGSATLGGSVVAAARGSEGEGGRVTAAATRAAAAAARKPCCSSSSCAAAAACFFSQLRGHLQQQQGLLLQQEGGPRAAALACNALTKIAQRAAATDAAAAAAAPVAAVCRRSSNNSSSASRRSSRMVAAATMRVRLAECIGTFLGEGAARKAALSQMNEQDVSLIANAAAVAADTPVAAAAAAAAARLRPLLADIVEVCCTSSSSSSRPQQQQGQPVLQQMSPQGLSLLLAALQRLQQPLRSIDVARLASRAVEMLQKTSTLGLASPHAAYAVAAPAASAAAAAAPADAGAGVVLAARGAGRSSSSSSSRSSSRSSSSSSKECCTAQQAALLLHALQQLPGVPKQLAAAAATAASALLQQHAAAFSPQGLLLCLRAFSKGRRIDPDTLQVSPAAAAAAAVEVCGGSACCWAAAAAEVYRQLCSGLLVRPQAILRCLLSSRATLAAALQREQHYSVLVHALAATATAAAYSGSSSSSSRAEELEHIREELLSVLLQQLPRFLGVCTPQGLACAFVSLVKLDRANKPSSNSSSNNNSSNISSSSTGDLRGALKLCPDQLLVSACNSRLLQQRDFDGASQALPRHLVHCCFSAAVGASAPAAWHASLLLHALQQTPCCPSQQQQQQGLWQGGCVLDLLQPLLLQQQQQHTEERTVVAAAADALQQQLLHRLSQHQLPTAALLQLHAVLLHLALEAPGGLRALPLLLLRAAAVLLQLAETAQHKLLLSQQQKQQQQQLAAAAADEGMLLQDEAQIKRQQKLAGAPQSLLIPLALEGPPPPVALLLLLLRLGQQQQQQQRLQQQQQQDRSSSRCAAAAAAAAAARVAWHGLQGLQQSRFLAAVAAAYERAAAAAAAAAYGSSSSSSSTKQQGGGQKQQQQQQQLALCKRHLCVGVSMQQSNDGGPSKGAPPSPSAAAERGISAESSSSDPGRSGSSRPDDPAAAAAAAESNGSSNSNTTTTPPSAAEDSLKARRYLLQQLPPAAPRGSIPLRRAASSPWAGRSPRTAAAAAAAGGGPAAAGTAAAAEASRRNVHQQLHYLRGGLFSPRGAGAAAAAAKERGQQQWQFAALPQQQQGSASSASAAAAEEVEGNTCCLWFRFYLVRFFELWGGDDFARRSRAPEDDDPFYSRGSISLILDDPAAKGSRGSGPRSSSAGGSGSCVAAAAAAAAAAGAGGRGGSSGSGGKGRQHDALGAPEQQQQQEEEVRRAAAAAAAAARRNAAARNPLRFAKEGDELAYRRYLNSLYPFRLLVVGLLMLFVDLMQVAWVFVSEGGSASEATRWPSLYMDEEVFLCIIITFGIVVVLYGLLAVASKLPFVGDKLEAFSITVLALAFMSRVASLCAVVLISSAEHSKQCSHCQAALSHHEIEASINKLPGEYVAVETPEVDATLMRAASSADACTAELILLSCAALFHTLILDVMLPVRTMVALPLHLLYLGSCVGVLTFCAVAHSHGLSYLGTRLAQALKSWLSSFDDQRPFCVELPALLTETRDLCRWQWRRSRISRRGVFGALFACRILKIVTDVHNIYQAQMSTEELREFRRFVPGLDNMDGLLPLECVKRSASLGVSPAPSSALLQLTAAPAAAPNAAASGPSQEACPAATAAAAAATATASSSAANPAAASSSAVSTQRVANAPAAPASAPTAAAAAPATAAAAAAPAAASAAAPGAITAGAADAAADVSTMLEQLPPHVADELREKLGIDWDLDMLMVDEHSKGNALTIVGNMMLQPLLQRDGLQCSSSQVSTFVRKVQQQYCARNLYHNQVHAAMVAHCCRSIVGEVIFNKKDLTFADEICIVVACIAHDLGHPGLTNQYLINVRSPLAITYNDISVLENYHAACCFRTAAEPEGNLFAGLKRAVFQYIRQHTIDLILATDMKKHFDFISHLRVRRDTPNFDVVNSNEDKWMVFKACIKAADLAHAATRWEQHKQWSERLAEEFYLQGDEEKRLGLPVSNLCDRQRKHEFSRSQAGFLKVLVEPLFTEVAAVVQNVEAKARVQNRQQQQQQREGRESILSIVILVSVSVCLRLRQQQLVRAAAGGAFVWLPLLARKPACKCAAAAVAPAAAAVVAAVAAIAAAAGGVAAESMPGVSGIVAEKSQDVYA
ncbi:hypothetical protein Emed_004142 [Eimeria media]